MALQLPPVSRKAREDFQASMAIGNLIQPGSFFPKYPAWGMYPVEELRELLIIVRLVSVYRDSQQKGGQGRDKPPVAPRSIQEQRKIIERQQSFEQQMLGKLPRGGFPDARAS